MIRRRKLLIVLAAGPFVVALPALAQDRRPRKIGFLGGGSAQADALSLAAFRDGMAALQWVEGRDYVIIAGQADNVLQALATWRPSWSQCSRTYF